MTQVTYTHMVEPFKGLHASPDPHMTIAKVCTTNPPQRSGCNSHIGTLDRDAMREGADDVK